MGTAIRQHANLAFACAVMGPSQLGSRRTVGFNAQKVEFPLTRGGLHGLEGGDYAFTRKLIKRMAAVNAKGCVGGRLGDQARQIEGSVSTLDRWWAFPGDPHGFGQPLLATGMIGPYKRAEPEFLLGICEIDGVKIDPPSPRHGNLPRQGRDARISSNLALHDNTR